MREMMDRQNANLFQYVQEMEARMRRIEEENQKKLQTLQDEVTTLRAQLAQQHAQAAVSQQEAQFENK
jgi:hypothetical protein